MSLRLFDDAEMRPESAGHCSSMWPQGCVYLAEEIGPIAAQEVLRWLDGLPESQWRTDLSRRVIHYGWRYDYRAKMITPDMEIGPLPLELRDLAVRLYEADCFERIPDQVIVNEYLPGQGIAMHTDHPNFGPTVATISLGDAWTMDFLDPESGEECSHLLEVGSALILSGAARNQWQHGIAKRKTEPDGRKRRRRVSLTFRTVESVS